MIQFTLSASLPSGTVFAGIQPAGPAKSKDSRIPFEQFKVINDDNVPTDLTLDGYKYAACRLFAHSRALQQRFAAVSYRLRLQNKRQTRCYTVKVPGSVFLATGCAAYIGLSITADGITVTHVRLLPDGKPPLRVPNLITCRFAA